MVGTAHEAISRAGPLYVGAMVELDVERVVAGGVGLSRDGGGKIVLCDGALPGECVRVEITRSKKSMSTGVVTGVLESAPGRVEPPCPQLVRGCGGCDLMFATPALQREVKASILEDALARIAKLHDVPIALGEVLASAAYRTVLRCGVDAEGRAGLRRRRSNELVPIPSCWVAHPMIDRILAEGRFPGAQEVVLRVGARTGDAMVVVSPSVGDATVPDGVRLVGSGGTDVIHELVGRRRFRISAGSFFQARPDGAEALVRAVARALSPFDPQQDRLGDLYGGVGLFTAGLHARRSVLVERSPSSAADARANLSELDAEIVQSSVERWIPVALDAVVADPARAGLGAEGVEVIAGTGAARVALVSCDPASLARDVRGLVDAGYEVRGVELVDMFPNTHHLEAVTTLHRS